MVNFWVGDITTIGVKPTSWTLVSSHLINAYTVDAFQPTGIQLSLVNYYMGVGEGNQGWSVPTMLRVKIELTQEIHL